MELIRESGTNTQPCDRTGSSLTAFCKAKKDLQKQESCSLITLTEHPVELLDPGRSSSNDRGCVPHQTLVLCIAFRSQLEFGLQCNSADSQSPLLFRFRPSHFPIPFLAHWQVFPTPTTSRVIPTCGYSTCPSCPQQLLVTYVNTCRQLMPKSNKNTVC